MVENGAGASHLVRFGAEEKNVERNGGDHVNDEPTFEVVHGNLAWMWHYFVILIDICSAEVDKNIYDEHDINWK